MVARKALLFPSHHEKHFSTKLMKYLSSTYMPETPPRTFTQGIHLYLYWIDKEVEALGE